MLLGASVRGLSMLSSPRGTPTLRAATAVFADVETPTLSFAVTADLLLRQHAGYSLHEKIPLGHSSADEMDSAVLAEGTTKNWAALRRLFDPTEDLYGPTASSPTTSHYLLALLPPGGWELGPDLERLHLLSTARETLKVDGPIVVCVFFGADHMGFHTCSEVLSSSETVKRFVDEQGLFAFHLSQNILEPMVRQSEEALSAEKQRTDKEKQRADAQEQRADEEKRLREAAEKELDELRAKIAARDPYSKVVADASSGPDL